ncbi:MAG TPA: CHASE domain-containing protein, partial [Myxococcota bacterium]|nr:CHASE domain-containing protein [Myxococcota bacterium]
MGQWITAAHPILDPETGRILAVLGVDIDAGRAEHEVFLAQVRGAILGVLLAFGWLALTFFRRRWHLALREKPPRWPPRRLLALGPGFVVFGMGLFCTVALFLEAHRRVIDQYDSSLRQEGATRAEAIRTWIGLLREEAEMLAHHLEAAQDSIHPEGWWLMASHMREQDGAVSVAWAPVVPPSRLPAFERELSKAEGRPVAVFHAGPTGRHPPLPQPEYHPLAQVEPRAMDLDLAGLDLASEPGSDSALDHATDEGRPAFSSPVRLPGKGDVVHLAAAAFLPAMPLATRQDRRDALRGHAVATYRMDQFLRAHLRAIPPIGLDLEIEDIAAPESTQ